MSLLTALSYLITLLIGAYVGASIMAAVTGAKWRDGDMEVEHLRELLELRHGYGGTDADED